MLLMFNEMLLMLDVTHFVTGSMGCYSCCYRFSVTLLILLQVQ